MQEHSIINIICGFTFMNVYHYVILLQLDDKCVSYFDLHLLYCLIFLLIQLEIFPVSLTFYLTNKVMNDKAVNARRVGSKVCN